MVGQQLFKTRICVLYRKGYCHRENCSFAHGDAELRRYNTSSSFNGRQDYRGGDLRDKLGRHDSPHRRNSLERDRFQSHGHDSPRFGKKSDWGQRKRHHFDGESEYSGSLRLSDGAETKPPSSSDDQLKHVKSEIDMLEDHKEQLEIYFEERVQEADTLNSKIVELERQLSIEKEECRRISSKIKKFVKAKHRHSRIQEELKRSEARLQKLGDQLGFDARSVTNEEDMSINILSDEETLISPKYDDNNNNKASSPIANHFMKDSHSPSKKRIRAHMEDDLRHSRWDPQTKNDDLRNVKPFVDHDNPTRRKTSFPIGDKFKEQKTTRMTTTIVDEVDDLNEEGGSTPLPPPPPLPVGHNAYVQYKGKDEKVDIIDDVDDGDDDDELLDVDIV